MHPEFIRFGPIDIHTYGVMVALGFALGLWVAGRRATRAGLNRETVADLGVWLIISGMLGGKLFHIIFFWNDFLAGWRVEGWRSVREGFVFLGGFVAASLTTVVYTHRKKISLTKVADLLAPSVALGHAFGRLGCFFNGCCYGKTCDLPWAVKFPEPHQLAGVAVHPTQLYETAGNLVLFAALSLAYTRRKFDGQIWWAYVLGYGVLRFGIECVRGDYSHRYLGLNSASQLIATVMIVIGSVMLVRGRRAR